MGNSSRALLNSIAQQLRFKELSSLIGHHVLIRTIDSIQSDLRDALNDTVISGSEMVSPDRRFLEVAMAKYGILDLTLTSPTALLDSDYESGLSVLRKLGFLQERGEAKSPTFLDPISEEDPTCLTELHEDLQEDREVVRLFLRSDKIAGKGPHLVGRLPVDYLPRDFMVQDACVTNAGFVWFHKHFYL